MLSKTIIFLIRCIVFLFIVFELVSLIVFPFFDYKYVVYDKNRYVINRNLDFENVLEYDENREICGYSYGKKQIVRVNGVDFERMLVCNYEGNIFIYDEWRHCWLEPENFSDFEYSLEKINNMEIYFADGSSYACDSEQKEKIYNFSVELLNNPVGVMPESEDIIKPEENGSIYYQYDKYPDNAVTYMFDIHLNNGQPILISATDLFGFNIGEYIIFN